MTKKLVVLFLSLWLPGCALTGGAGQAPQEYLLTAQFDRETRVAGQDAPVITVARPQAASGFQTRKMIYLRQPSQLSAFAWNRWAAPPAEMLSPLLIAALESTGAFKAVVDADANVYGRYRLNVELIKLQQEFFNDPSQIRLVLRATLIDAIKGDVLAAQTIEVVEPAAGNDPQSGVAAANRAVKRALAQIAELSSRNIGHD